MKKNRKGLCVLCVGAAAAILLNGVFCLKKGKTVALEDYRSDRQDSVQETKEREENASERKVVDWYEQEMYLRQEIPEIADYEYYIYEESKGAAHMILYYGAEPVVLNDNNKELQGRYYPMYVGEEGEGGMENWNWFFLREDLQEILCCETVERNFHSLERWNKTFCSWLFVSNDLHDVLCCEAVEGVFYSVDEWRATSQYKDRMEEVMEMMDKKYPFFGTWRIEKVAVISELYTGTTLDGDYEENLYDSADFIGYELEYSPLKFRLGDSEYQNPEYVTEYESVESCDRGGKFRTKDIYTLIAEEGIKVNNREDYTSETLLLRFYVKFAEGVSYRKYDFVPVGTQCTLLNADTMLVGTWGKVLLARRID